MQNPGTKRAQSKRHDHKYCTHSDLPQSISEYTRWQEHLIPVRARCCTRAMRFGSSPHETRVRVDFYRLIVLNEFYRHEASLHFNTCQCCVKNPLHKLVPVLTDFLAVIHVIILSLSHTHTIFIFTKVFFCPRVRKLQHHTTSGQCSFPSSINNRWVDTIFSSSRTVVYMGFYVLFYFTVFNVCVFVR